MQSSRVQPGRALLILLGLAVGHVALANPRITDDTRRITPRPTPVPGTAASQSGWLAFGANNASDIAVGANGVVWIIGNDPAGAADKNIYRWDGNAFQKTVGQAVRIAVDPNGKAWVVNSSGGIFRWIETSWQDMPGKAIDIGIGAKGEVWVLDPNGTPFKWDGNNWRAIGGGGWRIAVDPNGNPWVVNQGNQIWRWKGTTWELLAGSAKDIAIGPDGSVLIVSTVPAAGGFQIQRWADGQWVPEKDAAGAAVASGPAGALYVMKDTGTVLRGAASPAAPAPGTPPAVAGTAPSNQEDLCWKKTYGRGVGTVPTDCSTDYDKDAGLCYKKCPAGYKGVGPVCWQSCPDGWRTTEPSA